MQACSPLRLSFLIAQGDLATPPLGLLSYSITLTPETQRFDIEISLGVLCSTTADAFLTCSKAKPFKARRRRHLETASGRQRSQRSGSHGADRSFGAQLSHFGRLWGRVTRRIFSRHVCGRRLTTFEFDDLWQTQD